MSDVRFKLKSGSERSVGFCERNLNLLAHAQSIELDIGSECGGHGVCGKDRVLLDPASRTLVSPLKEPELEHLTDSERAQGWRLACQCFPESNDSTIVASPQQPDGGP